MHGPLNVKYICIYIYIYIYIYVYVYDIHIYCTHAILYCLYMLILGNLFLPLYLLIYWFIKSNILITTNFWHEKLFMSRMHITKHPKINLNTSFGIVFNFQFNHMQIMFTVIFELWILGFTVNAVTFDIWNLLTGIWLERALRFTIPCNDSTHFSSDSLWSLLVCSWFLQIIHTPCYISDDGKGIQSVAGKQNTISSGKLNGLVCPGGC